MITLNFDMATNKKNIEITEFHWDMLGDSSDNAKLSIGTLKLLIQHKENSKKMAYPKRMSDCVPNL